MTVCVGNSCIPVMSLQGHDDQVWSVVLTPDGRAAISASMDGSIRVWSLEGPHQGMCVQALEPETADLAVVFALALRYDGWLLASAHISCILLWDVLDIADGGPPRYFGNEPGDGSDIMIQQRGLPLFGHSGFIRTLVMTSVGNLLVSGSDDHCICVWALPSGHLLRTTMLPNFWVSALALSPDDSLIASASRGRESAVRLLSLASGNELAYLEGAGRCVAFGPDGSSLVTLGAHDHKLLVWDVDEVLALPPGAARPRAQTTWHLEGFASVVVSHDGSTLFTGSKDGTLRYWELLVGPQGPLPEDQIPRAFMFLHPFRFVVSSGTPPSAPPALLPAPEPVPPPDINTDADVNTDAAESGQGGEDYCNTA